MEISQISNNWGKSQLKGGWKIEKLCIYNKCWETNINKQKQNMNFKNEQNVSLMYYNTSILFLHIFHIFFSYLVNTFLILECLYLDRQFRYGWVNNIFRITNKQGDPKMGKIQELTSGGEVGGGGVVWL